MDASLPSASLRPVALGLGMGFTLLMAFGLPPVLQLAQVPPLRVIRRDVGNLRPTSLGVMLVGILGFAGLLLVVSSDRMLGLIAVERVCDGHCPTRVMFHQRRGWRVQSEVITPNGNEQWHTSVCFRGEHAFIGNSQRMHKIGFNFLNKGS